MGDNGGMERGAEAEDTAAGTKAGVARHGRIRLLTGGGDYGASSVDREPETEVEAAGAEASVAR
jgi:hypothetical protein